MLLKRQKKLATVCEIEVRNNGDIVIFSYSQWRTRDRGCCSPYLAIIPALRVSYSVFTGKIYTYTRHKYPTNIEIVKLDQLTNFVGRQAVEIQTTIIVTQSKGRLKWKEEGGKLVGEGR